MNPDDISENSDAIEHFDQEEPISSGFVPLDQELEVLDYEVTDDNEEPPVSILLKVAILNINS